MYLPGSAHSTSREADLEIRHLARVRKSITRVDVRIKAASNEVQRLTAVREKLKAEETKLENFSLYRLVSNT